MELQFKYDPPSWQWEARTRVPDSPFATNTFKIQIVGDDKPLREDQLALVQQILGWLPQMLPQIVDTLGEYEEDLKEPDQVRAQLVEPVICLLEPDENPSRSWSLTLERPSQGDAFGYHLEYIGETFQDIWAGD